MIWLWLAFIFFVLLMLALDLGVFHRKAHVVGMREALSWSGVWIALGLSFAVLLYFGYERHWLGLGQSIDLVDGAANNGRTATIKYITGYLIEKSLSVDNIFVIAMLFGLLGVPQRYQHRVLFWGILGALVLRGVMIGLGGQLIAHFHWALYVFGAFLIATAIKMLLIRTDHADPSQNRTLRLARRWLPITEQLNGQHFLAVHQGRRMLTPLGLALVMVETTDVIFAVDSIPAIFAITADPFLVFTSNVFAILGLRSLYFALAGMINRFRYLTASLAIVLAVVGGKMLAAGWLKGILGESFNFYVLGTVLGILAAGILASLLADWREKRQAQENPASAAK